MGLEKHKGLSAVHGAGRSELVVTSTLKCSERVSDGDADAFGKG